ncbi:hypothetical protein FHS76_003350 [Ochrobactrum daejeonense]|uniref:Uncharacterized protein n=1 Tax=Brucella daejeonensis TaxID=659015 RepID=A0A7W9AZQ4_9HYPH|nr:hypothetical protein [Brucella daejeonensis]MBB5703447.1 hypothetical protein [Brucella daejeonensis]NKB78712.1 hypothetical protein [Brucella daejeonensis]
MNKKKREIEYGRIAYAASGVLISLGLSYLFSDRLKNTADIISYVATVFSILAGVVIAIVSILGEPSMIAESSWRKDFYAAKEIQRKIHRHTDVFVLYIVLLSALFVFSLLSPSDSIFKYIQSSCFFLISLSFWMSLSLPFSLKAIQQKRMNKAIASRQKSQGESK